MDTTECPGVFVRAGRVDDNNICCLTNDETAEIRKRWAAYPALMRAAGKCNGLKWPLISVAHSEALADLAAAAQEA